MRENKTSLKPSFVFESVDLTGTFREWKSPLLSVEFIFIQTFEDLALAHKKLREKGKEFEFHDAEMKNKWERLTQKQTEFISNIKKYDAFFIENEEKSNRIFNKTKSKIEQREIIEENIRNCDGRIEFLTAAESKLKNSVELLAPYQNFLKGLVNNMKNFKCSPDLINFYVLMNSESQLLGKLHHAMLDREILHKLISSSLKNKMIDFHKQNNAIFNCNEECTDNMELKDKLEFELLNQVKSNQNTITDVLVVLSANMTPVMMTRSFYLGWCMSIEVFGYMCNGGLILIVPFLKRKVFPGKKLLQDLRNSCNNIFSRLLKWKKTKCPRNIDAEKKYTFIVDTVNELREAVELARQLNNKNDTSSQADSSFITSRRII